MTHNFDSTVLREYDIRGIIGETLGADDARAIGRVPAARRSLSAMMAASAHPCSNTRWSRA